jgi:uncharacterized protein (TIGR02466 family)
MIEPTINSIFPTPIYMSKLDRGFTKQELQFVDNQKNKCSKNSGNINTKDNYILNRKEFKNIKKFLDKHCKEYLETIICPKNNIELYITQSWLNYTETNQFHHKHAHSNSIVSGVFYINCHEELDKIKFFKEGHQTIKPEIKDWNLWNSETWWFTVKTGDIIMFPSSLTHMVETKEGTNTRISLAFNVFIKGTIGNNKNLTELIL